MLLSEGTRVGREARWCDGKCACRPREQVDDVLHTLSDREAKLLQLRFGLVDGRQRTFEEIGRDFGVTRERIRQIEAKALRSLRHPSRSNRLREFLE